MELWDLYDSERNPLGRTHVRGEAFAEGEYYVCVEVWIRNSKGEFLIQKRHPNNVGRCGHICNASYAVSSDARGRHIG